MPREITLSGSDHFAGKILMEMADLAGSVWNVSQIWGRDDTAGRPIGGLVVTTTVNAAIAAHVLGYEDPRDVIQRAGHPGKFNLDGTPV